MTRDAGEAMITRAQILSCLEILGLRGTGTNLLTRPEAFGYLLLLLEAGALVDLDRLDHEGVRAGYVDAARLLVTFGVGIEGQPRALMTPRLLARVVEDRIRRARLDFAELAPEREPEPAPHFGWGPSAAVDAALDAVLALLVRSVPPHVSDASEPGELSAMREAIDAQAGIRVAGACLAEGARAVQRMQQN
ncbi:hypothetical protein KDL01_36265 [Actinospica durhamensis]|uniref:Uncharacterized protein n=1 Tax=Actinospica durhamensis TaxID=1508375 RepID=A0A941EVW8_9ACTN|nr:hypothetical protein [Actinospica durhamensis]MBR7838780.1 hypothetical protein [Actinospica durhamensis]